MKIRVRFYGLVFDEVGTRERSFELEENPPINQLISLIVKTYPSLGNLFYDKEGEARNYLQVAINGENQVTTDRELRENDLVQVMPPIGGG